VIQLTQELQFSLNGGKTPGTVGEWTSMTTPTGTMDTSNTATMVTNTPTTSPSGDSLRDGPCTGLVSAMVRLQLTTLVDAVLDVVDAAVDAAAVAAHAALHQIYGGKTHGTHGEWTGTTLTTLTGSTTTFTTALKVESAISMTHPSGDTFQAGQWDNPETSVIHLTQAIQLNFNGGKTPGTHGEWTSTTTPTGTRATCNTASTVTNTPMTSPSGDTLRDGPCSGLAIAMVKSQLTTAVDAVADAVDVDAVGIDQKVFKEHQTSI